MPSVKIFPRKQIDLFLNYLHRQPISTVLLQDLKAAVDLQWDVTVDEFRAIHGFIPHPDLGSGANRGSMMVWATDPGSQAGDDTISDNDFVYAWNELVIAPVINMELGRPTQASLEAQYSALWAAAQVAATNLSVTLDTIPV